MRHFCVGRFPLHELCRYVLELCRYVHELCRYDRRYPLVHMRTSCVVSCWFTYARVALFPVGLHTHELRCFLLVYDNISVGRETGSTLLVATAIIV